MNEGSISSYVFNYNSREGVILLRINVVNYIELFT